MQFTKRTFHSKQKLLVLLLIFSSFCCGPIPAFAESAYVDISNQVKIKKVGKGRLRGNSFKIRHRGKKTTIKFRLKNIGDQPILPSSRLVLANFRPSHRVNISPTLTNDHSEPYINLSNIISSPLMPGQRTKVIKLKIKWNTPQKRKVKTPVRFRFKLETLGTIEIDTDNDGVSDAIDQCPNTPAGETVDATGCSASQLDSDNDGVTDAVDVCRNTPAGETVDAAGCSSSQLDSDNDGISDAIDQCPNTPSGETVDTTGCSSSQLDDDKDSVTDAMDVCPNTPAGEAVDVEGCSSSQLDDDNDGVFNNVDQCPGTVEGQIVDGTGCSSSQLDDDNDGVFNNVDQCPGTVEGQTVDVDGCSASQLDSDNDGISDAVDQCPNTPAGEAVDVNGCSSSQLDEDSDGVFNNVDQCPGTPAGQTVDPTGCATSQLDDDNDGVFNNIDQCPNTPSGETVDVTGCSSSQLDSDNDGVSDAVDICPNTPVGETVDATGCSPSELDSDNDGVSDAADVCPNTPAGEAVDATGCSSSQLDDDNDGVFNNIDQCPNTPAGETVDVGGCSSSQLDDDNDGVFSNVDQCPGTPAGATVNTEGCALTQLDSDDDGVTDAVDVCPNTSAGETVDVNGCSTTQLDSDNDGVSDAVDTCPNTPVGETVDATGCSPSELDSDNDGVSDAADVCPNTPAGATVNAEGCALTQLDSDNDGVSDAVDVCPNTPAGETVDVNGCSSTQLDDDNDGVFNNVDQCPNTPVGEAVDSTGCSASQLDSDNDGVFNNVDQCPNTPIGEAVDSTGCSASQLDSDNDGVFNNIDQCPNTPAGETVDATGCSASQLDSDNDGVTDVVDVCPNTPAGEAVDVNGCSSTQLDDDNDGVFNNVDQCPGTVEGQTVDVDGCSASQLDSDNDGISDVVDQCPNTPAGETVDATGCSTNQMDSDNDGVSDAVDQCPNTPAGETVDATGCSASQLDSDNDGVSDAIDQCPNTPAGETVDETGCSASQLDSDNDGISDAVDQCPNTPAGETVDATGCSASQLDSDNDGVSDAVDTCLNTPVGETVDATGCSPSQLDSDNDGVSDAVDVCPNTPAGETVDSTGCSSSQLDDDNDGVFNNVDICPDTPAGEAVDATGCSASQLDSDNDGVSDAADVCPNTPVGEAVDINGCSSSQLDDDNDGVFNNVDQCPGTPAGAIVSAEGCALTQLDSDNDGVSDAVDVCPNTPAGESVDATGCSSSQLDDDNDGVFNNVDQCPGTVEGQTVDVDGCSASQLDSDNDGVTDAVDVCPNTPAGEAVDVNGCSSSQLDDDSDGVFNNVDQCPGTPAGQTVDPTGCATSQLDDDNDGVFNNIDQCPNTPVGATVNAEGCSPIQLDSDNDSVTDAVDVCPNTPAGEIVDATGCSPSQLDDDNDGVFNNVDICPNTPAGETADATGCSTSQLDSDNDGVTDAVDVCPNTPAGETVDVNGCSLSQLDDDNDGVFNNVDQCPNTPAGETVDVDGCSSSQLDDDNDGVFNNVDQCPGTPAGATANAEGCALTQLDSDNDGVSDAVDVCPNTPAGETVDVNGCSSSQLDDDNDGVFNNIDQCPNTPVGEAVDSTGCSASQQDSDNDGVSDAVDVCPNTPAGETVDAAGCSSSQLDDDNDGIFNNVDQCPGTPAGQTVDPTGCATSQLDDDNDGVFNNIDQCSNTPAGEIVDATGCSSSQLDDDNDGIFNNIDQCPGTVEGQIVDVDGCSASQLDSDNDGVSDAVDVCPNTPAGETVDATGCSASQLDDDNDGVFNNVDQCPNTPAGESVDATGCSASQLDSDNDGISDAVDQCPNTPAGETVDTTGCSSSQLDDDNDGVFNNVDQCSNTPAGETVDVDGCSSSQLDGDNDGIFNDVDQCSNTPAGETVDAAGCSSSQLDDDGDGVFNNVDQCPNTPTGETVDVNGCSTTQLDSDDDGISDAVDQCPSTPAGATVDATGCANSQLDSDNDGVSDAADVCPNTPAGEAVDATGCSSSQLDDDNDGVFNNIDQCPNTPAGETVDVGGCSSSQLDDDNDGVFNNIDQCPGTPAGATVNAEGCALTQLDSDNDGVTDAVDVCPNTSAGGTVDVNGCSSSQLDDDNDSVFNNIDQCPNTPAGEAVDVTGCSSSQLDDDNDGVFNNVDQCPGTVEGQTVDVEGCSVSQLDDDNDGVLNNVDQCPNTPAGEAVDTTGCSASQLDFDNDGVSDAVDTCPNTPAGEAVDATGCSSTQLDSDNDGVSDAIDTCPNTPVGEVVDATGCSSSQFDDDNDGVFNNIDQCPGTVEGQTVDATGCSSSQLDSDNDGVTDALDICPNTPVGETVDATGCSASQLGDDNDGDGVSNNVDQCPNTPAGETVDIDGCSASQLDDDNDGVFNDVDQCPNTPGFEVTFEFPDETGCTPSQLVDSDNDGVSDAADICPNTPAGETVDVDGCGQSQLDDDGDGVFNDIDQCPNTSPFRSVFPNGCSVAQITDSDNDGVFDATDFCPDTPAGESVDEMGCSITQLDTDKDRVKDNLDQCPDTPLNEAVDEFGCSASQMDSDNDGVSDLLDHCPNTLSGEAVDIYGCSSTQTNYSQRYRDSKIPKTGADRAFHIFDDASLGMGVDRDYTRNDVDEVVVDNTNNLVWMDNAGAQSLQLNWNDAQNYCTNLTDAGITDWRIPTPLELLYLLNFSTTLVRNEPKINSAFMNADSSDYWTSDTTEVSNIVYAQEVDFNSAILGQSPANDTGSIRCVSGVEQFLPNFSRIDLVNVVIDKTNQIMWQDDSSAGSLELPWDEAINYCEELTLSDSTDWRLPHANELRSIFDEILSHSSPVFDNRPLRIASKVPFVWSSTTEQNNNANAHVIQVVPGSGQQITKNKSSDTGYFIRCVKDYSNPIAVSGGNQTVAFGDTVNFDGSNSSDPDGAIVTYQWVDPDSAFNFFGTTRYNVIYSTEAIFSSNSFGAGSHTITLIVIDNNQLTSSDTFVLTVQDEVNVAPVASSFSVNVNQNETATITMAATDGNSDNLSYEILVQPLNGQVSNISGQNAAIFIPNNGFTGTDSFTYKANDGLIDSNEATITINVLPINVPPVAFPITVDVNKNTSIDITLLATDANSDPLSFGFVTLPANGQLILTGQNPATYTPNTNFVGSDSFTFLANDGLLNSNVATVSLNILQVNESPVAKAGLDQTIVVGDSLTLDASASTDDAGITSYEWSQGGSLLSTNLSFTKSDYTIGVHTISLKVTDAEGLEATDTVIITVNYPLQQCVIPKIEDDSNYTDILPADDIPWVGVNFTDVIEIEKAFVNARFNDESAFKFFKMPEQTVWDSWTVQQQGLFLINSEREARGIKPYEGLSSQVVTVASDYAEFLRINNEIISHTRSSDGASPNDRLNENTDIRDNRDPGGLTESLYGSFGVTQAPSESATIVEAIYIWTYADKFPLSGAAWGHRAQILQTGLNENSGSVYAEGLIGFGVSTGDYNPDNNNLGSQGAVAVLNIFDPSSSWDHSNTQTGDTSTSNQCNDVVVLPVDESLFPVPVAGLRTLFLSPSVVVLNPGDTRNLTVTGIFEDGSYQNLTDTVTFVPDSRSIVRVDAGVITALNKGTVTLSANINGVDSNRVTVLVGDPTDISNLVGTFAEDYLQFIPTNGTIPHYDPKAFSLFNGLVTDRDGIPLPDVIIAIHHKPEFGSVVTDAQGRFTMAGEAGSRTIVYRKAGYLTLHRSISAASNAWATLEDVIMLEVDTKLTTIDLSSPTPQVHRSTIISDAFGTRSTTLVFNGINSATVTSADGSTRTLTEFFVRGTEFELPESMPAPLPTDTAFTYCSELEIAGVGDEESVVFDNPVVMYVDNFLNFEVGEIVPIGYYDRKLAEWIASENGVVVKLLDSNSDGLVDGLDYTGDDIADDINGNGSTLDEIAGIANYPVGSTYWRGSFNHFTPDDFNWNAQSNGSKPKSPKPAGGKEDSKDKECVAVSSYIKPKPLALHEDIDVTGTGLTLHYSSQRTHGYHHKVRVNVSDDNLPEAVIEMFALLEIGGNRFLQSFVPAFNQDAEFIWDGTDPTGKLIRGTVKGRISIGYKYNTEYFSSGNVATSGSSLGSFANAWAQVGDSSTGILGREDEILWNSGIVTLLNAPESHIANGWSLSNHHTQTPYDVIYTGNGGAVEVRDANKVLKTGITQSLLPGDDGFYQKGGSDIDYTVDDLGVLVDNVTGLRWQYFSGNPEKFRFRSEAINYCANLQLGDVNTPWRLPTFKELTYTIDKTAGNQSFPIYRLEALSYWSDLNGNPDQALLPVYCVQGESLDTLHSQGLQRNDTGEVVVDDQNGLMWQDDAATSTITRNWANSVSYCEDLQHAGFSDWRLPNINELAYTLPNAVFVNQTTLEPDLWFPGVSYRKPYWSSTPNAVNFSLAWAIESASFAYQSYSQNEEFYYARCVRDDLTRSRSPYVFDQDGKHIKTIDLNSGITLTTFNYNGAGKLSSFTDRFNNTVTINRDSAGKATSIVSPDGYTTALMVDTKNNLINAEYADGSNYTFVYENSLMTEEIDRQGNFFARSFDNTGRVLFAEDPEGGKWDFFSNIDPLTKMLSYGYTTAENNRYETQQSTLANSDEKLITTDLDDRQREEVRQADKLKDTFSVSGLQILVKNVIDPKTLLEIPNNLNSTLPSGLESNIQVDLTYGENGADSSKLTFNINKNNQISSVENDFNTGTQIFTSAENRILIQNFNPDTLLLDNIQIPGLETANYQYDSRGRLTQLTSGDRNVSFTFNDNLTMGNLTSITDYANRTTSFEYDVIGRPVKTTYPNGSVLQLTYDNNGNVASIQPPGQPAHLFNYNTVDRESNYTPPVLSDVANPATIFDYDRDRKLTRITRPDNKQLNFIYKTATNQLQSLEIPRGSYQFSYDIYGDLIKTIAPDGGILAFDLDGTLLTQQTWNGIVTGDVSQSYNTNLLIKQHCINSTNCIDYQYDNDNLLINAGNLIISREVQKGGIIKGFNLGEISTSLTTNSFAEVLNMDTTYNTNTNLYSIIYNRDKLGRIIQKSETIQGESRAEVYTYDDADRLKTVNKEGVLTTYNYDENGNRLNKIVSSITEVGIYDDQDRLLSYADNTYTYTENGELQSKTSTSTNEETIYDYDVLGNLLKVVISDGTSTTTIDYIIDGFDRRIGKKVNGVLQQGFLYGNQLNPVAELDGNNQVVSRFVYGTKINVPEYMIKGGVTYRILSDHLGSPRLVVNSANGDIAQRMDYDEFGKVIQDSNPGFQPFGFAGGIFDSHTRLVRFGVRDYDAEIGRWTAKDPIGFNGGDSNIYAYVGGDPVNRIDPNGLFAFSDVADWAFGGFHDLTGWEPDQSTVDFSAGLGDALLLGFGDDLRELVGVSGGVNKCSDAYRYGEYASIAAGGGRLAYAVVAKGAAVFASSGAAASAFRNKIKIAFRGGLGKNWRKPNLKGKSDAQLRASAGKTNKAINAYGAGVAASGASNNSECECQ